MDNIDNQDELLTRLHLNRQRLAAPGYRYPEVFAQGGEWYGDWQGRILLALCSLYVTLPDEQEKENVFGQISDIVLHLDDAINTSGYFGPLFQGKLADEQQIAGNSWFLRGLCEYYKITQEQKIISHLMKITDEFLLPLKSFFEHYPQVQRDQGEVAGHTIGGSVDGWKLSSDVGCAFIMVDGMTAVYEITHDVRLWEEITIIIQEFKKMDPLLVHCQTHATLSFIRGVLRFYQLTKNVEHLEFAQRLYEVYLSKGMTIDYANLNWFGRPDSWTEPCAIVDSFIIAKQLYLFTHEEKYLPLANRIYRTAIRTAQRANGGAGCNTCAYGDNANVLSVVIFEAFFCCSMRLAEGLKEIADFQAVLDQGNLLLPLQGTFTKRFFNGGKVTCLFDPMKNGRAHIVCDGVNAVLLKVYIPTGCSVSSDVSFTRTQHTLSFVLKDHFEVMFDYEYTLIKDVRQGHEVCFLGDTLWTRKSDGTLSPVSNGLDLHDDDHEKLLEYVY